MRFGEGITVLDLTPRCIARKIRQGKLNHKVVEQVLEESGDQEKLQEVERILELWGEVLDAG